MFFLHESHQLNSVKNPPFEKFPPCCVPIENKGGIFHFLENFQKSQVLECSEKLKNEVLSNLEGVDFWSPESQKVKNPPLLCTDRQQGGNFSPN